MKIEYFNVSNIGELKKAIRNLPDDTKVSCKIITSGEHTRINLVKVMFKESGETGNYFLIEVNA